jgi:thiol:disulfide interchange protein
MNKVKRNKKIYTIIAAIILVLGVGALVGSVFTLIAGISKFGVENQLVTAIIITIVGVLLVALGVFLVVLGIYHLWIASALVATEGNIAEGNDLANKTLNSKKCPKCGCTNTGDVHVCQSCGEKLD